MPPEPKDKPFAIERLPYKQDFIEVRVYEMLNGRYKAWPYIVKSNGREVFVVPDDFETPQLAVQAAVEAGQKKMDGE